MPAAGRKRVGGPLMCKARKRVLSRRGHIHESQNGRGTARVATYLRRSGPGVGRDGMEKGDMRL